MKKTKFLCVAAATFLVSGCATNGHLAASDITVQTYDIFDIKTDVDSDVVIKAATDGLALSGALIRQAIPRQASQAVPVTPGRLKIEEFSFGRMNVNAHAIMQTMANQNGGVMPRVTYCEGAIWWSRAVRSVPGAANLNLFSCLYKYQGGYQLNTYAVFQKTKGSLSNMSPDVNGMPQQWISKTIFDTLKSIVAVTGSGVMHIDDSLELP